MPKIVEMPFDEPAQTTIVRNGALALGLGTIVYLASAHRISWPVAVVTALWPTFGGHWVELWYLNWLSPRIAPDRLVQGIARLASWLVGGVVIAVMMRETAVGLGGLYVPWHFVWLGGVAFIGIELVVHAMLAARAQRNFYSG